MESKEVLIQLFIVEKSFEKYNCDDGLRDDVREARFVTGASVPPNVGPVTNVCQIVTLFSVVCCLGQLHDQLPVTLALAVFSLTLFLPLSLPVPLLAKDFRHDPKKKKTSENSILTKQKRPASTSTTNEKSLLIARTFQAGTGIANQTIDNNESRSYRSVGSIPDLFTTRRLRDWDTERNILSSLRSPSSSPISIALVCGSASENETEPRSKLVSSNNAC